MWLRSRGYRLNGSTALTGYSFEQYGWGVTAGADKTFDTERGVNLLGAFIDMGRANRKLDNSGDGTTNTVGLGAYFTLLRNDGWFADAVARLDRYGNNFTARAYDGRTTRGNYTVKSFGLSVEGGRHFRRTDGWWIEPTLQAAALWLSGANYSTHATPTQRAIKVRQDDSVTYQYRALVRFGRQLLDTPWHPYGKFAAVSVESDSGEIHSHGKTLDANYDGRRVEFGFGTMYRLDATSQIYFDYEYARSANYERPWSLTLGYRRLW